MENRAAEQRGSENSRGAALRTASWAMQGLRTAKCFFSTLKQAKGALACPAEREQEPGRKVDGERMRGGTARVSRAGPCRRRAEEQQQEVTDLKSLCVATRTDRGRGEARPPSREPPRL